MRRFQPYATEHRIALTATITEDVLLTIHKDDYIQILQNLVKNAIDYNKKNGKVIVSLRRTNKNVVLTVTDTGIGIEEEAQQRVFSRFTKIDSARKQDTTAGSGLGLAIVKEVVSQYGGSISLSSTPSEGTEIIVTLPQMYS